MARCNKEYANLVKATAKRLKPRIEEICKNNPSLRETVDSLAKSVK